MIYALFMKTGIKSEIHDCTIFALNSIFQSAGIISPELCKELKDSRDLRVGSLYYDKDFDKKEIMKRAETAPDFCLRTEDIIDSISREDVAKLRLRFGEVKKE